ncbi:hypothetical protein AB0K18_00820 [Nonomuraea sp. NPDC049421]|uniref:hypothetical protein n=1 Tax=Nonomuraea sp. NPDC049421 TaxID=3155275 RepID=UPI0034120E90
MTCHEGLVRLLAEEFARADASLRELESRAGKLGGTRLPRATCADMLAGRRFPKKAVMLAFLRACRVPEERLPEWERAWERVRVGRLPVTTEDAVRGGTAAAVPGEVGAAAGGVGSHGEALASGGDLSHGAPSKVVVATVLAAVVAAGVTAVVVIGLHRVDPPPRRTVVGRIVTDDGRAFGPGGWSRFTVRVSPANTGVRLIRRLDVGVPLQQATITVDGLPAGAWPPLLGDDVYKWRDQVVDLPPEVTAGRRSLTVVNTFASHNDGFNEFRYDVQHQVGGRWSTADTLDVGPAHTADEAAHDYRIEGEGWRGSQTFAYPPSKEDWTVR